MRRAPVALIALSSFAALGTLTSSHALAGSGAHPCFNDQGAIPWYRSLAEAQASARASGKLIFIESGRLECTQCRRLVSGILPYEPVRSRMAAVAVGLADDCDDSSPAVAALFNANLPHATMLPLVGFITPDLRWVTGWSGGTVVGNVQDQLAIAEGAQRQIAAARAAESRPPPCAGSTPAPVATPRPAPAATSAPMGRAPSVPPALSTPSTPTPRATPSMPAPLASRPTPTPAPAAAVPAPIVTSRPSAPPAVAPPPPAPLALGSTPTTSPTTIAPSRSGTPSIVPPAAPLASALPPPAIGPVFPPAPRAATPIERARAAAAREAWGEVLRISDREGPSGESADGVEMAGLVERACSWTLRTMSEAERLAAERRTADAKKALERMRHELEGTGSPVLVDADRGLRAVDALAAIEAGSPDGTDSLESLRRRAYSEFRGSRWAPLFRSR